MEINLFTGAERGFLGGHLKKNITGSNIDYGDILNYKKADKKADILVFCPVKKVSKYKKKKS